MKPLRVILIGLAVIFWVGCAGGDLLDGDSENQGDGSHVGDADGDGGGTGDGGTGDGGTGDGGTGDSGTGDGGTGDGGTGDGGTGDGGTGDGGTGDGGTGDGGTGDGGTGDGGTGDGGTGDGGTGDGTTDPCALVDCSEGVCDPDTGDCVDCLSDGDCGTDLVCDDASQTCIGCSDHGDCPGAQKCHDQYPVCVAECCDFVVESVFADVSYSHDRIDIAVTDDGNPMIVFAENVSGETTNKLHLAQRISGQWLSQNFADYTGPSINLRLDLDSKGDPHVVTRKFNEWLYFHRDGSGWHEEDVWNEELSGGYTDIKVGDDGTVHFIGDDSDQIHYARRSPDGTWLRQSFTVLADHNNPWVSLGLKSDGSPVVSTWIGQQDQIFIAERIGGTWTTELAAENATQVHHMAVGPSDEIRIVHRPPDSPHDGLKMTSRVNGTWEDEVVTPVDTASVPYIDIDDRGDPHVVFSIHLTSTTSDFGYTRWDGNSWETHEIQDTLVERAFWQRVAVDGSYVAHIVIYDSALSQISYLTVEP